VSEDTFEKASEKYDADSDEPQIPRDHPRHLSRLSPINEAKACETVAEVREKIEAETELPEPRKWVIALLNERIEEIQENEC